MDLSARFRVVKQEQVDSGPPVPLPQHTWDEFWNEEAQVCGLCGNSGFVDTVGIAVSARGVPAGVRGYCICPNGRAAKLHGSVDPGRGPRR